MLITSAICCSFASQLHFCRRIRSSTFRCYPSRFCCTGWEITTASMSARGLCTRPSSRLLQAHVASVIISMSPTRASLRVSRRVVRSNAPCSSTGFKRNLLRCPPAHSTALVLNKLSNGATSVSMNCASKEVYFRPQGTVSPPFFSRRACSSLIPAVIWLAAAFAFPWKIARHVKSTFTIASNGVALGLTATLSRTARMER